MNSQSVNNVVQTVTGIAVLIGLGLVVWELRQTRQFMEFEAIDRSFAQEMETRRASMGENPMQAYAKACAGEELTLEDQLVLENYFGLRLINVVRGFAIQRRSDVNAPGARFSAERDLTEIFALRQGQAWYQEWASNIRSSKAPAALAVIEVAEEVLERGIAMCGNTERGSRG